MKQLTKSKKIMILIAIIILIAGIAITITKGLNFDLKYQGTQSVQLYIGEKFNEADIRQITKSRDISRYCYYYSKRNNRRTKK